MDREDLVLKNQDDLEEEGDTEADVAVRPGEARPDMDQASSSQVHAKDLRE